MRSAWNRYARMTTASLMSILCDWSTSPRMNGTPPPVGVTVNWKEVGGGLEDGASGGWETPSISSTTATGGRPVMPMLPTMSRLALPCARTTLYFASTTGWGLVAGSRVLIWLWPVGFSTTATVKPGPPTAGFLSMEMYAGSG